MAIAVQRKVAITAKAEVIVEHTITYYEIAFTLGLGRTVAKAKKINEQSQLELLYVYAIPSRTS